MLIVVTGGSIAWDRDKQDSDWVNTTALNKALSGKFPDEPLYVDLRWTREHDKLKLHDLKFHLAVLHLGSASMPASLPCLLCWHACRAWFSLSRHKVAVLGHVTAIFMLGGAPSGA